MTTLAVRAAAALSLAVSAIAHAQFAPGVTVQPATELRVTLASPATRLRGFFVSADNDSLRVQPRNTTAPTVVSFANVKAVHLRGGRDRRRGVAIGGAVLGGVALVFGGVDVASDEISAGDYVGTVVTNALIGGLVGYLLAPRGWIELPLR